MKTLSLLLLLVFVFSASAAEDFSVQSYSAGVQYKAIALGDYNGDGIDDVWAGDFNGYKIEIWTYNHAKDSLEKVDEITGLPYGIHDIAVADLDGDEDMDAAVAVRGYGTYVCINNGDSWDVSNIDESYGWQVVIADFDLDENLDILAATDWNYLKIFSGDGAGSFTLGASPPLVQNYGDSKGLNVVDINNDSRPDIIGIASEWMDGGDNQYFLRAYTNIDTGNINWTSVGPSGSYSLFPNWTRSSPGSAGDLNKDGYIDLVGFTSDNRLYIYHGGAIDDSLTWTPDNVAIFTGQATAAVMSDIDNDTYPDVIYSGYNNFNDLHIYYNNQKDWFIWDSLKVNYGVGSFHSLKTGDVTGNGWKDILASKYSVSDDGFVLFKNVRSPERLYVDVNATGNNSGLNWTNAYTKLSQAVKNATNGAEIWVATGTYFPDTTGLSDHREASFTLEEGIALYGGFAGTETTLSERDWANNLTILSGDIGVSEDSSDNCYHVVRGNTDTRLDGFSVTGGNASGLNEESYGGGIHSAHTGSTDISNCVFEDNYALAQGGAVSNYFITDTAYIDNCQFINNTSQYGGAIDNHNSPNRIDHCLFTGDSASLWGSAIYNWGAKSSSHIRHSVFAGNLGDGGTIHNRASGIKTYVINSIFYNNGTDIALTHSALCYIHYSRITQSGYIGKNNNITDEPLFLDESNGNFHLAKGSQCIDAGTSLFSVDSDTLLYNTDYKGSAPDIGLYESNYNTVDIGFSENANPSNFQLMQNYPNPFNPSTIIHYSVGTGIQSFTEVDLSIYNLLGEKMVTLFSGSKPAGSYRVTWNATGFPSGIYFYKLKAGDFMQTRRMLLIK